MSSVLGISGVAQMGKPWNEHLLGLLLNLFSYSWLLRFKIGCYISTWVPKIWTWQAVRLLTRLSSLLLTPQLFSGTDALIFVRPWSVLGMFILLCSERSFCRHFRSSPSSVLRCNQWQSSRKSLPLLTTSIPKSSYCHFTRTSFLIWVTCQVSFLILCIG